jgi:hypothetical protein
LLPLPPLFELDKSSVVECVEELLTEANECLLPPSRSECNIEETIDDESVDGVSSVSVGLDEFLELLLLTRRVLCHDVVFRRV